MNEIKENNNIEKISDNKENIEKLSKDLLPRKNSYTYDLQLKVNAIISKSIFNEELLVYKTKVDLTKFGIISKKESRIWIYIVLYSQ